MKDSGFTDFVFRGTYYYANMISNILESPSDYIRSLSEFWEGDYNVCLDFTAFQKESVFHSFAYFVLETSFLESITESNLEEFQKEIKLNSMYPNFLRKDVFSTEIEYYAKQYGFDVGHPWIAAEKPICELTIDDINIYYQELPLYCDDYEKLIKFMANEVFNVLFPNRVLMAKFNSFLAGIVSTSELTDIPPVYRHLFKQNGVLKRARIPEWAKRAVKYRDHGYCVCCHKDISEEQRNISAAHIDHIVPLAEGGLNDISNLQLLCEQCNTKKGGRFIPTNNSSIDWYK